MNKLTKMRFIMSLFLGLSLGFLGTVSATMAWAQDISIPPDLSALSTFFSEQSTELERLTTISQINSWVSAPLKSNRPNSAEYRSRLIHLDKALARYNTDTKLETRLFELLLPLQVSWEQRFHSEIEAWQARQVQLRNISRDAGFLLGSAPLWVWIGRAGLQSVRSAPLFFKVIAFSLPLLGVVSADHLAPPLEPLPSSLPHMPAEVMTLGHTLGNLDLRDTATLQTERDQSHFALLKQFGLDAIAIPLAETAVTQLALSAGIALTAFTPAAATLALLYFGNSVVLPAVQDLEARHQEQLLHATLARQLTRFDPNSTDNVIADQLLMLFSSAKAYAQQRDRRTLGRELPSTSRGVTVRAEAQLRYLLELEWLRVGAKGNISSTLRSPPIDFIEETLRTSFESTHNASPYYNNWLDELETKESLAITTKLLQKGFTTHPRFIFIEFFALLKGLNKPYLEPLMQSCIQELFNLDSGELL